MNHTDTPLFSRRQALQLGLAASAAAVISPWLGVRHVSAASAEIEPILTVENSVYPFVLPPLPYAFDALEPHFDARTMEIHYDKHHAAYVKNLNDALKDHPELHKRTLGELISKPDDMPEAIRTAVRNNAGGHANHALFWLTLANPGTAPSAELLAAIEKAFGSVDALKEKMRKTGLGQFGSGWSWLCLDESGNLTVVGTPNQDSPWRENLIPLLGVDVWEHAYYLKYQNRRADYLVAWDSIVDWAAVSKRHAAMLKK